MRAILDVFYPLAAALVFLVGLAGAWRIARGPTVLDRLLGFDALTVATCALIAVFSIQARTGDHMELIIVVAGLGFFTTVAFFYYLGQTGPKTGAGDLDEPEETDRREGGRR